MSLFKGKLVSEMQGFYDQVADSDWQWRIQRVGAGGHGSPRSPCPNIAVAKVCRI